MIARRWTRGESRRTCRRPLNKCASNARNPPGFLKIGKIGSYRNFTLRGLKVPAAPAAPTIKVSRPLNAAAIANRVYILALEAVDRVIIKEVVYVNLGASWPWGPAGTVTIGRPLWVPDLVQRGNWCQDPPCYWTTKSVAMRHLNTAELMYNPLADYSLEIIRWYRPDIFENLFQRFSVRNKWSLSAEQLALLKDTIKPQSVQVDDFDSNFSQSSPAAVTLNAATLAADFMPVIDHYMALLSVRTFRLRGTLMLVR